MNTMPAILIKEKNAEITLPDIQLTLLIYLRIKK